VTELSEVSAAAASQARSTPAVSVSAAPAVVDYDGRRFSPVVDDGSAVPVAHYHQRDDLVWGEFSGADVRGGSLIGTSSADGVVTFAYHMLLVTGELVSGVCRSEPEFLADGRVRFTEYWERFGPHGGTGVSILQELPR
jgi:hypothetical protein